MSDIELISEVDELDVISNKSISQELNEMLIESNPENTLNNNPEYTILLIVDINEKNPCGTCIETINNVSEWADEKEYLSRGVIRILLSQSTKLDNKFRLWSKLNIQEDEVPKLIFFDKNKNIIDILSGNIPKEYLDKLLISQ